MAALGVGLAVVGTFCSAVGYTLQKTAHNRAARDLKDEQAKKDAAVQAGKQQLQETPASSTAPALHAAPSAPVATSTPGAPPNTDPEAGAASGVSKADAVFPPSAASAAAPATAGNATPAKPKSYWRYWQFPAGLGFLILGAVFAVFVFGLAGQSELAPMGAVTMIFNTILAWRFLNEPFTRVDFIATSLMAVGTTVAIAFGESSDAEYNLDELIDLLDREVVWWVFGGEMLAIFLLLAYVHTVGAKPVAELTPWQRRLDAFGRPFIGGALSGFTGFLTKSSVEVAFNAVDTSDGEDWERWELYVFLVALGLCIFLQLKYMNSGLGRYDSMMIIPIYQSVLVIAAAVSGLVFFDELRVQSSQSVTLFIVGCSITASGICVLLLKKRSASDPDTTSHGDGGPVTSPEEHAHAGLVEMAAVMAGNTTAAAEAVAAGDDDHAEATGVYPRRWSEAGMPDSKDTPAGANGTEAMVSPESSRDNPLDEPAVLSPSHVAGTVSAV